MYVNGFLHRKTKPGDIDRLRRSSGNGGELPDCAGIAAALEAVTLSLKYRHTLQ